ncbi:hypothetical protein CEXT_111371 [Caerostris extrusa]|uniref:Uncharacterized protein n=1 Tax=Caerostris extrusa TaxID=172846 RepID=A0AAV4WRV7_CAEEX|nr:hypothetical protein CEXT_111371 [Caerostris extrusa]
MRSSSFKIPSIPLLSAKAPSVSSENRTMQQKAASVRENPHAPHPALEMNIRSVSLRAARGGHFKFQEDLEKLRETCVNSGINAKRGKGERYAVIGGFVQSGYNVLTGIP